jgi:hypothetical protein
VDDTAAERRWPAFCRAAAAAGFASCLVLPLRTDRQPAGAIALYGPEPDVFRGAAHDVALLVAAQGGAAVHNATLYRTCRRMVDNLHAGLETRAVIEQAKGVLHAELNVSPDEAFRLLSRYSQNTNQRVRKISAELVEGRISAADIRPGPLLQGRCYRAAFPKSGVPPISESSGLTNDETNCLTRLLNWVPMTTATASSMRFPRMMKFLKPLMAPNFPAPGN